MKDKFNEKSCGNCFYFYCTSYDGKDLPCDKCLRLNVEGKIIYTRWKDLWSINEK